MPRRLGLSGGQALARALQQISDRLSSAREVRVGFLEGATYPITGRSVAMVAAINEFGAPSRGIPPRPFFRGMIAEHKAEWGPVLAGLLKANDYNAHRALDLAGEGIVGQLRQSIVDFSDPPNAPSTVARKGFNKPLIDTGHMLDSVDHEVVQ